MYILCFFIGWFSGLFVVLAREHFQPLPMFISSTIVFMCIQYFNNRYEKTDWLHILTESQLKKKINYLSICIFNFSVLCWVGQISNHLILTCPHPAVGQERKSEEYKQELSLGWDTGSLKSERGIGRSGCKGNPLLPPSQTLSNSYFGKTQCCYWAWCYGININIK